jgi:hypothetical protein
MSRPRILRVKICGITTREDALTAASLGADALGFLVDLRYESEDALAPDEASKLIAVLPPFISPVLVTHQSEPAVVGAHCRLVRPHVVQLHGDFDVEAIPRLREGQLFHGHHHVQVQADHGLDVGIDGLSLDQAIADAVLCQEGDEPVEKIGPVPHRGLPESVCPHDPMPPPMRQIIAGDRTSDHGMRRVERSSQNMLASATVRPAAKRARESAVMSMLRARPSTISSAISRPTAGECMKPWPENPHAM